MYSWPEPAACATVPLVTWGEDKKEKIKASLRQNETFSVEEMPNIAGRSSNDVNWIMMKISHMLDFSRWETFLCSSWLCALQAAILEEIMVYTTKYRFIDEDFLLKFSRDNIFRRHSSLESNTSIFKTKHLWWVLQNSHLSSYLLSSPSIYSFFFFLLSWADCLLRIFLRIFFRILSSPWLRDKGHFQLLQDDRCLHRSVTVGNLPL